MWLFNQLRLLWAFSAFTALAMPSLAVPAPVRSQIPPQTSSQSSGEAPAAIVPIPVMQTVPQPPPTPEQLGDAFMAHQRYQAAIEAYKKAPRDSAGVWNKMGIAYQLMFNSEEALRCYEVSLKIDPRHANVLNNLGTIYDALKQYGAAERMYRKALKIEPASALIHKNLGTVLLAQHKYEKGWDAYKQALALDPQIFENSNSPRVENTASLQERGAMNYYMAKSCVRVGKNDQAIEYLRMALNEGFTSAKKIAADSEFASLRGIPAFEQLLAAQRTP
jgi:tetratricopeptide (TPR) repeat protein